MSRFFAGRRQFRRIGIAMVLVAVIATSLWFAVPTQALTISLPALPPSGTLGNPYNFTVQVEVADTELLPIQHLNLLIYNVASWATYQAAVSDLPLTTGSRSYTSAETHGGNVDVVSTAGPGWGTLYGYGYANWQGYPYGGYNFFPPGGYGYGYGYSSGATSIIYNISWYVPASWPAGSYQIDVNLIANGDTTLTKTSTSFIMSAPSAPVPTPTPTPAPTSVAGVTNVTSVVNTQGVFTQTVNAVSEDSKVQLNIPTGTTGKTKEGAPLSQINVVPMTAPPAPPASQNIIGLTYDFGPEGATFNPPATITFTYNPAAIPVGVNEKDLVIAFYDKSAGKWVTLDNIVVDPVTHTISGRASHFTAFTVIAPVRPAAFTATSLTISPAEAKAGEPVTISVNVTNTGSVSGSYDVTLKINSLVVETKKVTLAAQASQKVTFTTTRDTAGTYAVTIDNLSGTLTVKAVSTTPTPVPATFTIGNLSISPATVKPGEQVTISVPVTNTGDISGTYKVSLKINNVEVSSSSATLAGKSSQNVVFVASKDAAGTYSVDVNGQTGKFTVQAPVTPPAGGINWLLIGSIIAAVIVAAVVILLLRREKARRAL